MRKQFIKILFGFNDSHKAVEIKVIRSKQKCSISNFLRRASKLA